MNTLGAAPYSLPPSVVLLFSLRHHMRLQRLSPLEALWRYKSVGALQLPVKP